MGVSWIYKLRKDQLIVELAAHHLQTEGNVEQLRQRLVAYVRKNHADFLDKPDDPAGYNEELDKTKDQEELKKELGGTDRISGTSTPTTSMAGQQVVYLQAQPAEPDPTRVFDQMRKWNCHFEGRNLYCFLERLKELQGAYGFTDQQILKGFPELLRGDAQLWYRNLGNDIVSWDQLEEKLRKYFLSPGELRHLDQQIHDRRQSPNESIRSFTTALMTLMRRRGGYDSHRQLDTLYYNMRPEARLHIRRTEIFSAEDLICRVEELEETLGQIKRETKDYREPREFREYKDFRGPPKKGVMMVNPGYDRNRCCWRCKQRGHSRFNCNNPQHIFCSYCGQDDILTKDCPCPRPGNERMAEPQNHQGRPGTS